MNMRASFTLLLAAWLMQGCGSMLVGAPAPAASKEPEAELRTAVKDDSITADVRNEFLTDSRLRPFAIWVNTGQGVVTLTGAVDSHSTRAWAGSVAARVRGVVAVDNQLSIGTGSGYH
jgi:osmotically-inducible protein OsmY